MSDGRYSWALLPEGVVVGEVVERRGRPGFYDVAGGWHWGLPAPSWGDYLGEVLPHVLRSVPAALETLGVRADGMTNAAEAWYGRQPVRCVAPGGRERRVLVGP